MLKHLDRWNLTAVAGMILPDHANRSQRVAAEIEEAVVNTNFVQLQLLAPESGQLFFDRRLRSDEFLG